MHYQFELRHCFEAGHSEKVYGLLLDFHAFGKYHPAMVKLETVQVRDEFTTEYEVHERIRVFGVIPLRPVYKVQVIRLEKGRKIRYHSQVKKHLALSIEFILDENDRDCNVLEIFRITGNRLTGIVFAGILKKTHLQTVHAMKKALSV